MPRFKVVEVEGYSEISSFRLGIGVSVLDTAYNYAEVARFRSEHEQRRGGRFCTTAESWARARSEPETMAALDRVEAALREAQKAGCTCTELKGDPNCPEHGVRALMAKAEIGGEQSSPSAEVFRERAHIIREFCVEGRLLVDDVRPLILELLAVAEDRTATLERIAEQQPKTLAMIERNGFVFESIGSEPGNWQHLAFSIYTDLCEVDSIARSALDAASASRSGIAATPELQDSGDEPEGSSSAAVGGIAPGNMAGTHNLPPLAIQVRSSPQAATPDELASTLAHWSLVKCNYGYASIADAEKFIKREADVVIDALRAALVAAEAERDEARRERDGASLESDERGAKWTAAEARVVTLEQALREIARESKFRPDILRARRALAATAVDLEQEAE